METKIKKVVLLGAERSGKSKLFDELTKNELHPSIHLPELTSDDREAIFASTYESTPDITFKKAEGSNTSYSDTRPYQSKDRVADLCYGMHDWAIVVVDSTNAASFEAAKAIITKVRKEYSDTQIMVAVTKTDLAGQQLDDLEAKITGLNVQVTVRTSALTGAGVEDLQKTIGFGTAAEKADVAAPALSARPRVKPQKAKTINPAKRFYATLLIGSLLALAAIAALVLVGLYVPGAGALMMNIMNIGGIHDAAAFLWSFGSVLLPAGSFGLAALPLLREKSFPSETVADTTLTWVGAINFVLFIGFLTTLLIAASPVTNILFFNIPTAIAGVAELAAMVLTPIVTLAASVVHYAAVRAVEKAEAVEAQGKPAVEFPQMREVVSNPGAEQGMGAENGSEAVVAVDSKNHASDGTNSTPSKTPTNS